MKRAFRRFAGRSILSHQVDCALDLGCEAVCCLVSGLGQDVIACQHRAEMTGMRFQAIENPHRLSGIVKADDEVIVITDGLLPDSEVLVGQLAEKPAVLTFPAEQSIQRGYERIDAENAWAGAMRLRGDAVSRLADLPEDSDAISALLRIALQSGVRQVSLDADLLARGEWVLQEKDDVLAEREKRWIAGRAQPVGFAAPGRAVAERIGIRLGKDIVGTRFERGPLIAGVAAGVFSGLAASFGHSAIALGLAFVMTICLPMAGVVRQIGRVEQRRKHRISIGSSVRAAADLLLVGLLAQATPSDESDWMRLFIPTVLIGLLRFAERAAPQPWATLLGDRILLVAVMLVAHYFGQVQPVAAGLIVATLATLLIVTRGDRLTAN